MKIWGVTFRMDGWVFEYLFHILLTHSKILIFDSNHKIVKLSVFNRSQLLDIIFKRLSFYGGISVIIFALKVLFYFSEQSVKLFLM